jgi:hypothetical protein
MCSAEEPIDEMIGRDVTVGALGGGSASPGEVKVVQAHASHTSARQL